MKMKTPNHPSVVYSRYVVKDHGYKTPCWDWTGVLSWGGYGMIRIRSKQLRAHRVSAEISLGKAPTGKPNCCHKCDNRKCIRPDHLYWGTQKQNIADAIERGGGWRHNQKLTESDCDEIRKMAASKNYTLKEMAVKFNVSHVAIHFTITGKRNSGFGRSTNH